MESNREKDVWSSNSVHEWRFASERCVMSKSRKAGMVSDASKRLVPEDGTKPSPPNAVRRRETRTRSLFNEEDEATDV